MCSPNCLYIQRLTLPMFLARGTSLFLVMNKELWNVSTDVFTNYVSKEWFWKHMFVFFITPLKLTLDIFVSVSK